MSLSGDKKLRAVVLSRGRLRIASRSAAATCPPLRFGAFPLRRMVDASRILFALHGLNGRCFLLRKARKSAEGDGTVQPNCRRRMRPIIRRFRHSLPWTLKSLSLAMAKPSKSAAPRFEELRTEGLRQEAMPVARLRQTTTTIRTVPLTLFHTKCGRFLARRQLKPICSPRARVGEKPYNRPRIQRGRHGRVDGFRFLPFLSVVSVVKTQHKTNHPLKTPRTHEMRLRNAKRRSGSESDNHRS